MSCDLFWQKWALVNHFTFAEGQKVGRDGARLSRSKARRPAEPSREVIPPLTSRGISSLRTPSDSPLGDPVSKSLGV